MKRVVRIERQGKVNDVSRRALATVPAAAEVESRVALIQSLIPLGLQAVADALEAEVVALAGERYRREGGQPGVVRWSREQGSIYLLDQKLLITYTRVRDLPRKQEVSLRTYTQLREPRAADAGLFRKGLRGLICRDYAACAEAVPEGIKIAPYSERFQPCQHERGGQWSSGQPSNVHTL
jgi:hypothetical protein